MTQRSYSMSDAYRSIYKPALSSMCTLREALELLDEEDVNYILEKLEGKGLQEAMSIKDQMKAAKAYNRKSPEEKKKTQQKAVANIPVAQPKKDKRSDAQKMTDAADDRSGSFYREFDR